MCATLGRVACGVNTCPSVAKQRWLLCCLGNERVHWCALCDACVGAPAPMTVTSPRHWGDVSAHTTHALSSCNLGTTHWAIAARPLVIHGWRGDKLSPHFPALSFLKILFFSSLFVAADFSAPTSMRCETSRGLLRCEPACPPPSRKVKARSG